jgi:hypothetical protein
MIEAKRTHAGAGYEVRTRAMNDGPRVLDLDARPLPTGGTGHYAVVAVDELREPGLSAMKPEPSLALIASQIRAQQLVGVFRYTALAKTSPPFAENQRPASDRLVRDLQRIPLETQFHRSDATPIGIASHDWIARGLRLEFGGSHANVGSAFDGNSLSVSNRVSALTFGAPSSGFLYRIQLTSTRIQARTSVPKGGPRLGPWPVLLSMVAAGVMLYSTVAHRPAVSQIARAAPPQEIPAAKPVPPPVLPQPEAKAQPAPPPAAEQQQKAAPVAAPPQERVATSKTASIRTRPEMKAPLARTVPAKLILNVFDKKDDWLEVGSTYPWGWVQSSSTYPYTPPS